MINKKWSFYTFMIILLLFICFFSFIILSDIVQTANLNQQMKKYKTKGIKTSIKELNIEKPQNQSTVNIISEASKILAEDDISSSVQQNILANALNHWENLTAEEKDAIRKKIEDKKETFNKYLLAAEDPHALLNIDPNTFEFADDFKFARFRDLFRWVILIQGKLHAEEGNTSASLACARDGIKITRILYNTPNLLSNIMGNQLVIKCFELVQDSLSGVNISREYGEEFISYMKNAADLKEKFRTAIDSERIFMNEMINRMLQGDENFTKMFIRLRPELEFLQKPLLFALRPTLKADIEILNDHYINCRKVTDLPYQEAFREFENLEKKISDLSKIHFIIRNAIPGFKKMYRITSSCEAKYDITKTAICLKMYKAENKKFPDSIYDLVPDYMDKLPIDPFTNDDYIYRKLDNGGFLLYSPFDGNNKDSDKINNTDYLIEERFSNGFPGNKNEKPNLILWYEKPY